jgi:LmbE family N-acetylglucosaminyl deacetylase
MRLCNATASVFVPDGSPVEAALARTTHLAIGAHPDDVEIMATGGIFECLEAADRHFTGVTVTTGSGSPRSGAYVTTSDEDMARIRREEQQRAAALGRYSAHVFLGYESAAVKDGGQTVVTADIRSVLEATRPQVVYTHDLGDRHDTHLAVALRAIRAIRELPPDARPRRVLGCEVWRSLDWLPDGDRVALDVGGHDDLAGRLLGVFTSQVAGGKRYDLATLGRRRANATFLSSTAVDASTVVTLAMDLTPLCEDPSRDVAQHVRTVVERLATELTVRIARLGGGQG